MQMVMRMYVHDKVKGAATTLFTFQRERAHEVMALMLDPRYCLGQTFQLIHDDIAVAKALWKRYTEEVLVPTTVILARGVREQQSASNRQMADRHADSDDKTWAAPDNMGLCDDTDSDVDDGEPDEQELKLKVETELRLFRKASDLPPFACKKHSPLAWWRAHATLYPSLANLARVVLAVPGS